MSAPQVDETWTTGRLLEWTTRYFTDRRLDTPRLDAEVLLAHVLACQRIELYTMYDAEVSAIDRTRFRELVLQRAGGCPVAYLVGSKEFYSLRFDVDRSVLIPRPETEHLVVEALAFAAKSTVQRFLDMGTGSGALAVTLAHLLPNVTGVAVDLSPEALAVARRNAESHGVSDRLQFVHSDLFDKVPREPAFDLIVSNPPYIASEEFSSLPVTVRDHEPRLALEAGPEGLDVFRRLVDRSADYLRDGGKLLLEIGSQQEQAVRSLLEARPQWSLGPTVKDLAGHPRCIQATKAAKST